MTSLLQSNVFHCIIHTTFFKDLKMIDDEKYKRLKDVIKVYGLSLNEKQEINSAKVNIISNEFLNYSYI